MILVLIVAVVVAMKIVVVMNTVEVMKVAVVMNMVVVMKVVVVKWKMDVNPELLFYFQSLSCFLVRLQDVACSSFRSERKHRSAVRLHPRKNLINSPCRENLVHFFLNNISPPE